MKSINTIIISLLSAVWTFNGFCQSHDVIVFESKEILLTQNLETSYYRLVTHSETYENLKFVKQISFHNFQVLDTKNRIFYVGMNGEQKDKITDPNEYWGMYLCDSFYIQKTNSHFLLLLKEDVCFFDPDETVAEKIHQVSTKYADSVLFINGKNELSLDSSFLGLSEIVNPETLILVKDGKYFTEEDSTFKFDSIDFSNYANSLKTKKDDLYGILGVVKPKYKSIDAFHFFLARAVTVNDEIVYIDHKGNEFPSKGGVMSPEDSDIPEPKNVEHEELTVREPVFSHKLKRAYWDLTELCLTDKHLKGKVWSFLDTLASNDDEYYLFGTFMDFIFENDIQFIQVIDWKSGLGDLEWLLNKTLDENYRDLNVLLPSYYNDQIDFMEDGVLNKITEPLKARGLQLGFIDTQSDSYTFVVHGISEKGLVKKAVIELGFDYWEVD